MARRLRQSFALASWIVGVSAILFSVAVVFVTSGPIEAAIPFTYLLALIELFEFVGWAMAGNNPFLLLLPPYTAESGMILSGLAIIVAWMGIFGGVASHFHKLK